MKEGAARERSKARSHWFVPAHARNISLLIFGPVPLSYSMGGEMRFISALKINKFCV
jgi:hypothetical protein